MWCAIPKSCRSVADKSAFWRAGSNLVGSNGTESERNFSVTHSDPKLFVATSWIICKLFSIFSCTKKRKIKKITTCNRIESRVRYNENKVQLQTSWLRCNFHIGRMKYSKENFNINEYSFRLIRILLRFANLKIGSVRAVLIGKREQLLHLSTRVLRVLVIIQPPAGHLTKLGLFKGQLSSVLEVFFEDISGSAASNTTRQVWQFGNLCNLFTVLIALIVGNNFEINYI